MPRPSERIYIRHVLPTGNCLPQVIPLAWQSRVRYSQFKAFLVGEALQTDCHDQCAVQIQLVSSESLPKTGIFAVVAGDFFQNGLRDLQFGSSETGAELQKPANSGLFCFLRGDPSDFESAWLPREGSNSNIPKGITAIEISREFRFESVIFNAGDFGPFRKSKVGARETIRDMEDQRFREHWEARRAVCLAPNTGLGRRKSPSPLWAPLPDIAIGHANLSGGRRSVAIAYLRVVNRSTRRCQAALMRWFGHISSWRCCGGTYLYSAR